MSFIVEEAWQKATSTSSQALDISAAITAIAAKVKSPAVAVITTETQDLVVKFGTSGVTASDTLTADKFPTGNYPCVAGSVQEIAVGRGNTHIAFKAEGVGNIKIAVGYNE